ncbi:MULTISPECIES: FecR family protein [unclassified Pseudomonas]|uniref:FecR family protein n=1 Tax=unclassified Pseudomonas TaxID=196821 RepID=UPI00244862C4|nr:MULTISPECIES: FecR family protein [unclassified Pseudomonas]MDH0303101.1 FecR family protein [Pseudomonas sp. GD04091]MDH1988385.1 FecR family protein [Pseudomonas sp. GD03689]
MSSQNEQAIREQAAEWVVLQQAGPLSPTQQLTLEQWCASDPRHARAYGFAQATWADLGQLTSLPAATPLRPASPRDGTVVPRRRPRLRRAVASAAVLLLAVLALEQGPQAWLGWRADYLTGTGEIRQVTLPDGSQVELDSRSAIQLAFDEHERRVRLLSGEAVFSAAPVTAQEARPFVVEYAGATSRALGTRFVVGEAGEGGWVGMLEHRVAVELQVAPAQGEASQVLEEGQCLRYDQRAGLRPWPGRDLRRATDWQRGVLVFERQPLDEVVARLNRYRAGRLVIANDALARREVSGVFRLDQLGSAPDVLGDELKARLIELPGLAVLY